MQDLMAEPMSVFWIFLIRKASGFIDYSQEKELEIIVSNLNGFDLDRERELVKIHDCISQLTTLIDFSIPVENVISEIIREIGETKVRTVYPQYRTRHLIKVKKSFSVLFEDALEGNSGEIKSAIDDYEGKNGTIGK